MKDSILKVCKLVSSKFIRILFARKRRLEKEKELLIADFFSTMPTHIISCMYCKFYKEERLLLTGGDIACTHPKNINNELPKIINKNNDCELFEKGLPNIIIWKTGGDFTIARHALFK